MTHGPRQPACRAGQNQSRRLIQAIRRASHIAADCNTPESCNAGMRGRAQPCGKQIVTQRRQGQ